MRLYSITRYDWNGYRDIMSRPGSVVACSTEHALETAIRTWGAAHYTALEIPSIPYGHDNRDTISCEPTGSWYEWHISKVGKQDIRSPHIYSV